MKRFIIGVIIGIFIGMYISSHKIDKKYLSPSTKYKIKRGMMKTLDTILKKLEETGIESNSYNNTSNHNYDYKAYSSDEKRLRIKIIKETKKYIGKKYVYGGDNPYIGFDCSGLVQYVYYKAGIHIPRSVFRQYSLAVKKDLKNAKIGDLLFFKVYKRDNLISEFQDKISPYTKITGPTHVGIYIGNNLFIHAPREGLTVEISKLNDYWKKRLCAVGDFVNLKLNNSLNYKYTKKENKILSEDLIDDE